jgi:hypothetical protein
MSESGVPVPGFEIADAVSTAIKEIGKYARTREEQATERYRITTTLNAFVKHLQADREKFEMFFKQRAGERERILSAAEKLMETGTLANNMQMIQMASDIMMGVLQNNALGDYNSSMKAIDTNIDFGGKSK